MAKRKVTEKSKKRRAKKTVAKRGFTVKQQRFIDCYAGDIKEAAKKARLSYDYARRLVTKSHILKAIRNRQDTEIRPKDIGDRQERQALWTKIMRDETEETKDRLRASELLGKSEADFTENLSHRYPEGCGVMLVSGPVDRKDWERQSKKHHRNGNSNRNTS